METDARLIDQTGEFVVAPTQKQIVDAHWNYWRIRGFLRTYVLLTVLIALIIYAYDSWHGASATHARIVSGIALAVLWY
jgi:hypothetical protein